MPFRRKEARRILQRVLHHLARALDGQQFVVVRIERGDLAHRDLALGNPHLGIEERGEGDVGLRVEELHALDGVHHRRVLLASARRAEFARRTWPPAYSGSAPSLLRRASPFPSGPARPRSAAVTGIRRLVFDDHRPAARGPALEREIDARQRDAASSSAAPAAPCPPVRPSSCWCEWPKTMASRSGACSASWYTTFSAGSSAAPVCGLRPRPECAATTITSGRSSCLQFGERRSRTASTGGAKR